MNKKPTLTPEEKALFREAMKNVAAFKQDKHKKTPSTKSKKISRSTRIKIKKTTPFPTLDYLEDEQWIGSDGILHFTRSGLQDREIQRIKRGKISLEARLDLHRLTLDEAAEAVFHFIQNCQQEHKRWVLIIHGKGHFSQDKKPRLKNMLNQLLRNHSDILAFHSAQGKDGGTGAVYVLLKRIR